ncbi:hypothetical protein HMI55_001078 [Coelomomyces lativittatus]|nr:hypothetical protein HMI55_001078 [Coelomomyces lativittatus]
MPTETIDVNGLKQESTRSFTINEAVHDFNNLNDPSNVESSSFSTPTLEPGFMEPSPPLRYERYSYTPGQATKITRFSYSQTNPKPTKVFLPFSENSGTVESSSTQSKLNDTAPEGIDLISKIEKNSISNQGLNHAFNSMSIENQNAKTDLIDHPEIKDSSIYTSNSPPSIVKTQREEINKDEKKPIDGPSMKKTTSIKKPRSHNRKNKSKDENLEDSTIIPINFVPLSNIKHHKSKTSRAMSSEELKELEKNGAKKKKDFSLNQDHRQDGIYSFSELSHDFLKTKVIATRAQSASNLISSSSTKPSVTPRSSDLNTNQKKRPSLHDGSASDLVHFQIDASHKVIFTCLSTLPIETELKNQVEELLRNQMAFIHEAYNVQNENFNLVCTFFSYQLSV